MKLLTGVFAVVAAAFLVAGTGCADSKLTTERNSLATQNKDYAEQLKTEREARQQADTRANMLAAQLAAAPTPAPTDNILVPDLGAPRGPAARTGTTPVRTSTAVPAPKPVAVAAGKVTIPGKVLFDSGKTTLTATATKTLDTIAATIKKQYASSKLVVEGFTDSTPPSKNSIWASNDDLAKARANSVKKYLVSKGIKDADITIKAMGATELVSKTDQAQNRRVEVAVVK